MKRKTIYRVATAVGVALMLTIVYFAFFSGNSYSKYTTIQSYDDTLTVTDRLATTFQLLEPKATMTSTGIYTTDNGTPVTSNSYILIPGIAIAKRPYIKITGKTTTAAYLYVEVIGPEAISDLNGSGIAYSVDTANWTRLTGLTGPHGGALYTYGTSEAGTALTGAPADLSVDILTNDCFEVGKTPMSGEALQLSFRGYLLMKQEGKTAAQTFEAAAITQ